MTGKDMIVCFVQKFHIFIFFVAFSVQICYSLKRQENNPAWKYPEIRRVVIPKKQEV